MLSISKHEIELAWGAGFFDGEGCTAWSKRNRCITVTVGQTEITTLQRFQRAMGGVGNIYGPSYRKGSPHHRPYWYYRVSRDRALQVLRDMWPYLSEPKRQQALRIVAIDAANRNLRWKDRAA
jgi:hypothetical protein